MYAVVHCNAAIIVHICNCFEINNKDQAKTEHVNVLEHVEYEMG